MYTFLHVYGDVNSYSLFLKITDREQKCSNGSFGHLCGESFNFTPDVCKHVNGCPNGYVIPL